MGLDQVFAYKRNINVPIILNQLYFEFFLFLFFYIFKLMSHFSFSVSV